MEDPLPTTSSLPKDVIAMNRYRVTVNGKEFNVLLHEKVHSIIKFEVENEVYEVEVTPTIQRPQHAQPGAVAPKATPAPRPSGLSTDKVVAPMPGIVVNVAVEAGAEVQQGQVVCVVEAMKMENNITSPKTGKVKEVLVKGGQEVDNGQALIVFE